MTDQSYYHDRRAAEEERIRLATSLQAKAIHQQLRDLYRARAAAPPAEPA